MSSQGIQLWTVPSSGNYQIIAAGAKGSDAFTYFGGNGIIVSTNVYLNIGTIIAILVGQTVPALGGAGGGGTFVVYNGNRSIPILCAGGGGGAKQDLFGFGENANSGINNSSTPITNVYGGKNGSGGLDQFSGAGFYTDGVPVYYDPTGYGKSYLNGGEGANGPYSAKGGFGGGGSGDTYVNSDQGGGGGYSGGSAFSGGCSYDINNYANNYDATIYKSLSGYEKGYNPGNGFVIINKL
jgi:hypothetical protein